MVELLQWMDVHSLNREIFQESLAKGGQSGTLKSVFRSPELEGKVIGKSGSMEGVLGYCGYFTADDGDNLAFCFVVNNYLDPAREIRQKMDGILTEVFKSQL